jgi:hypothetical protein
MPVTPAGAAGLAASIVLNGLLPCSRFSSKEKTL